MSMQYLSKLYAWLRLIYVTATIWEHEIAENCLHIMSHFRNTHFMWKDCRVTIRKVIERMNKLLVVNETKYGYSMECEDDELYEAYSSLRYVDVIIGNFLEHRKEGK